MPANLPPQYFEAEKRYREAKTPREKVEALEEMLTIMPKHKGTDKLRADLRRKISKFKTQSQQKKGVSRRESAYSVDKEGAAQVVVIGPANVGKSSLIATLTNATPEVADFPHSTWKPTPGMVPYENIQFQLVDTPPISRDYIDPWMADLIRRADILVILLDLHGDALEQLENTFSLLRELRVFAKGEPIPGDLKKRPFVKKMLVVVNKMDEEKDEEDYEVFTELSETHLPSLGISTHKKRNLTAFIEKIYDLSAIIRVYTKAPGKEPDLTAPFVLPRETTLEELAAKIHKDFLKKLKFARIWGKTVFDGQMVQRDYVLQDGDVVEMHI
ncbi:MAG: TGS domain-containing protein [Deltaproteobacteria bacterium]|nr:MAG: TGS domain-containing protein [Deltaproteobacteria bacterium]